MNECVSLVLNVLELQRAEFLFRLLSFDQVTEQYNYVNRRELARKIFPKFEELFLKDVQVYE